MFPDPFPFCAAVIRRNLAIVVIAVPVIIVAGIDPPWRCSDCRRPPGG
jgi:hypothetical protein